MLNGLRWFKILSLWPKFLRWLLSFQQDFIIFSQVCSSSCAKTYIFQPKCPFHCPGNVSNFDNAWQGSQTSPGYIALSFYSGLFSYSGWTYLNFVTEELRDPYRNLPRAIWISLPTVTIIYALANIAYFSVLTTTDILNSSAVAVTFGNRIFGIFSWIMPLSVACSTFGGLNGGIFASSRLYFVGARSGHLPSFLSMINIKYLTPMPSILFLVR